MIYRAATGLVELGLAAASPLLGPDWRERMVRDRPPCRISGGVWVHAASVGELNSAQVLILALAAARPVLITTNSVTGRAVARGWGLPARLAPLDTPGAVGRFLDGARPGLMLSVENEIWPNRAAAARRRGIAQAVVGARLSARSAARWARAPGLLRPVLGGIALLSAQDPATEARLLALGLPRGALAPRLNLKLLGPAALAPVPPGGARAGTWLAASTHPGEDEIILAAHRQLTRDRPAARLILAPRHPDRADAVAALARAQGLSVARLPADGLPGGADGSRVVLVDRLGALGPCYAAAGICLTGGSLVNRGGHTPWEPAAHGCALLHGPHVANFADDYALLDRLGAAHAVTAEDLAATLARLTGDPAAVSAMGAAARRALDEAAPDPAPLIDRLLALAPA